MKENTILFGSIKNNIDSHTCRKQKVIISVKKRVMYMQI